MTRIWEDYLNYIPAKTTQEALKIGRSQYHAYLRKVSAERFADFTALRGQKTARLVDQKEKNFMRCFAKYLEVSQPSKTADGRDLPLSPKQHQLAADWMREAREWHKDLAEFMGRAGLIPREAESSVTVNNALVIKDPVGDQLEAIMGVVRAKRAQRGSGGTGASSGQLAVGEGQA